MHAYDVADFLAGPDDARLADLDAAIRDPGIRAVFATRGGKGSYRIADRLDHEALRRDPKPLVGFSDVTALHLAIAREAGVTALHGPMVSWDPALVGRPAIDRLRATLMDPTVIVIDRDLAEPTAALSATGRATGVLLGGNQDAIATAAGWALPPLDGCILLLEAFNLRLGHLDRQLTMLRNAGHLDGIVAVAVGQYTRCGPEANEPQTWSHLTVLRHHLEKLGVPILGGLPIGHGADPHTVPLGTPATVDVDAGTLTIEPAAR